MHAAKIAVKLSTVSTRTSITNIAATIMVKNKQCFKYQSCNQWNLCTQVTNKIFVMLVYIIFKSNFSVFNEHPSTGFTNSPVFWPIMLL